MTKLLIVKGTSNGRQLAEAMKIALHKIPYAYTSDSGKTKCPTCYTPYPGKKQFTRCHLCGQIFQVYGHPIADLLEPTPEQRLDEYIYNGGRKCK